MLFDVAFGPFDFWDLEGPFSTDFDFDFCFGFGFDFDFDFATAFFAAFGRDFDLVAIRRGIVFVFL